MLLDFNNKKIGDTVIHSEYIIYEDSDVNEVTITDIDETYITCKIETNQEFKFYKKTGVKIYNDYHPEENDLTLVRFYPDKETAINYHKFKEFDKLTHYQKHCLLYERDSEYKKAWDNAITKHLK